MEPEFSVVIPTHDRPAQLAACLRALAAMEYARDRFEVLVVDDGGSAPLDDLVSSWHDRLDIRLTHQENAGPGSARNKGALGARGRYIAFTDDDCEPSRSWLTALEGELASHPNACIGGRTVNALPKNLCSTASQLLIDYLYVCYDTPRFFASNNLCVPAAGFRELGGFDTGFPLAAGEDREFCSRWLHEGRRLAFAQDVVVHHAHPLRLRSFWSQHFNYGRGAQRFHVLRARREGRKLELEPLRFYLSLLLFPFKQLGIMRASLVSVLLAFSQLANAAGFFYEKGARRKRRSSSP